MDLADFPLNLAGRQSWRQQTRLSSIGWRGNPLWAKGHPGRAGDGRRGGHEPERPHNEGITGPLQGPCGNGGEGIRPLLVEVFPPEAGRVGHPSLLSPGRERSQEQEGEARNGAEALGSGSTSQHQSPGVSVNMTDSLVPLGVVTMTPPKKTWTRR